MTRPQDVLLPQITLDREATTAPLHHQLRDQLASAIRTTASGTRLPSTRLLARILGVSRNTVISAYDELAAEGLIEGRRGAAMVVAPGRTLPPTPFNMRLLLREAGYPGSAVDVVDPDGNPLSLTY